jgi:nucleoside-diphosphate-sugar epimerase
MPSINNVLITGGTGFVGYWMQQSIPPGIKGRFIGREEYEDGQWKGNKYDGIVHLANISPAAVLKQGCRVLYASSGAAKIRGRNNDYGYNKHLWEGDCKHSGVDIVIARLYAFSGERLQGNYALTDFIRDAKSGGPIIIKGNGKAIRSYLYGRELGLMMWALLLNGHSGKTYEVGGQMPYTIYRVAQIVSEVIPSKIEILNEKGVPNRDYRPEIGIPERVKLKEAIERMANERR